MPVLTDNRRDSFRFVFIVCMIMNFKNESILILNKKKVLIIPFEVL